MFVKHVPLYLHLTCIPLFFPKLSNLSSIEGAPFNLWPFTPPALLKAFLKSPFTVRDGHVFVKEVFLTGRYGIEGNCGEKPLKCPLPPWPIALHSLNIYRLFSTMVLCLPAAHLLIINASVPTQSTSGSLFSSSFIPTPLLTSGFVHKMKMW